MTRVLSLSVFLVISLLFSLPALAKEDAIYTSYFSDKGAGGYDVVSYFTENQPVKGQKKFTTEWMGSEWQFSSQENLDKFKADPVAYAPRFGGYCSWAMANGYTASGDPKVWKIVDGRLYLNYNKKVQKDWEQDIPGFIEKAQGQYPEVTEGELY